MNTSTEKSEGRGERDVEWMSVSSRSTIMQGEENVPSMSVLRCLGRERVRSDF